MLDLPPPRPIGILLLADQTTPPSSLEYSCNPDYSQLLANSGQELLYTGAACGWGTVCGLPHIN